MAIENRIDVIKGVKRKIYDAERQEYKFGPLIPFSANAAAIYFPKREGQTEDHTLQEKVNSIEDDIITRFENIIPNVVPSTVSATTSNIGEAPAEGVSEKYARQDHQHQILIDTGDASGQIKIGGINVTVKDWATFGGATSASPGSSGLVPAPRAQENELYLKANGTWSLPTTYAIMSGPTSNQDGQVGLVPAPAIGDQDKFLRGDATWVVPENTTYDNMTGATASSAGKRGLVPAPTKNDRTKYLRGDATWAEPENTTYEFSNGNPTLKWGTKSTVGTVGGTALTVTMPANPNTNTTYAFTNSNPTLKWNTTSTVGTVGGTALTVKMPAQPINTTYAFTNSNPTLKWNTTSTVGTVGGTALTVKMPAQPVYGNMKKATASSAGAAGLAPAPAAGQQGLFLRGDATWATPTNTTYAFNNKGVTLAWDTVSTIATVGGTNITIKLPANPNTWPGAATSAALGLIKVNAGTGAATTTNCPVNCIYFKY